MITRSKSSTETKFYDLESIKKQGKCHDTIYDFNLGKHVIINKNEWYYTTNGWVKKHLDNKINFDECINAWNENKKKIGNGMYVYICGKPLLSSKYKTCQHKQIDKNGFYSGCKRHYMWEEKKHKLEEE
jgi:hypothetical protein